MTRKFNYFDYFLVLFLLLSIVINVTFLKIFTVILFLASVFDLFNQKRIYKKTTHDIRIFESIPIRRDYFRFKRKDFLAISLLILLMALLVYTFFLLKRKLDDFHVLSFIVIGIWRMIKKYQLNNIEDTIKIISQGIILPGPKAEVIKWIDIKEVLLDKKKFQIVFKFSNHNGYKLLIDKSVKKDTNEIFDFIEKNKIIAA